MPRHLSTTDSITSRNQTHDFEIFCRKLCERTICPNLKPATTGPEEEGTAKLIQKLFRLLPTRIALLSRIWGRKCCATGALGISLSAKRKWAEKVRNDVAGIVATQRGYQKVYCVTAQFARRRIAPASRMNFRNSNGVTIITILDRSWIVDQVVSNDRKDPVLYLPWCRAGGCRLKAHGAHRLLPLTAT